MLPASPGRAGLYSFTAGLIPSFSAFAAETERFPAGSGGLYDQGGGLFGYLILGRPFTGLTTVDLLILGVIAFFLIRLLRSNLSEGDAPGAARPPDQSKVRQKAQEMWRILSSEQTDSAPPPLPGTEAGQSPPPAGFDREDFLKGAKMVYTRLYDSRAQGDLEDIRQFSTDEGFEQFAGRPSSEPKPGAAGPKVLMVEAELAEVSKNGDQAQVRFHALLSSDSGESVKRDEIWRFIKDPEDKKGMWLLSRIRPLQ